MADTTETRLVRLGEYLVYVGPVGRQRKGRVYRHSAEGPEAAAVEVRERVVANERARIVLGCQLAGIPRPDEASLAAAANWVEIHEVRELRAPEYRTVDVAAARRRAEQARARRRDRVPQGGYWR